MSMIRYGGSRTPAMPSQPHSAGKGYGDREVNAQRYPVDGWLCCLRWERQESLYAVIRRCSLTDRQTDR